MGALNEQLVDGLIGHAVELDRAAEGLTADVLKAFHQLDTALASAIRDSGVDDVQRTYYRQQRGEKIISQTARAIDNGVRDARVIADADLLQFAQEAYAGLMTELESLFTVKVKFTKLTNATLRGIVKDAMVQGATQQQWWDKLAMDAKRSFSMGVRQGTLDRQAGESLVNRAVGKRTAKVQDSEGDTYFKHSGGMMDRIKTDAETILKTLASTIAEDVRQAVVEANIRFFNGSQAIATLDSRTSQLCRGRDHMAWDGDGNPIESTGATFMFPGDPPWHFRCRTFLAPILKNYNQLKRIIPNLPSSYANLLDGQAARKRTYAQWFDKQSQARQRAILGAGKYDLYQSGKLTLQQMLDNKGNPLRVSQLRYRAARLAKGKK